MDEEKKVSEILPPTEILAQMSEEYSEGAQAVNWAIKDMTDPLNGDDITFTFSKTFLPDRFIIHWCKKDKACICDLIGWKVGEEAQDNGK